VISKQETSDDSRQTDEVDDVPSPGQKWKKRFIALIKTAVAIVILVAVLSQSDIEKVTLYARSIPAHWLILAFASFTLAQLFSTLRMNTYYRYMGRPINFGYSLRLYYVGMFYNVILPGGIGGDAYKVYQLKRAANYPIGEGVRIQLLTRLNGLLILLMMLFISGCAIGWPLPRENVCAIALLFALLAVAGYGGVAHYMLKEPIALAIQALPYSVAVQSFNVLTMVALWAALGQGQNLEEYVFLFQLAAIAGMIPITIGGLGIREFTFFYGAQWIGLAGGPQLDGELGVSISLIVFAITVLSACIGLLWLSRIGKMVPYKSA